MLKADLLQSLQTPCYALVGKKIDERYHLLRKALPEGMKIYYSFKANAHPEVIKRMKKLGAMADVASRMELAQALECGFRPEEIEFTGPGKTEAELRLALESGVSPIIVESLSELRHIADLASGLNKKASLSLRINPLTSVNIAGKELQSQVSQFGIDEESIGECLEILESPHLALSGLHFYTHSQFLDAKVLARNFRAIFASAQRVSAILKKPLHILNLGGGFGIPYYQGTDELNLEGLSTLFSELQREMKLVPWLQKATLAVEAGRFLTAPAGYYLARVRFLKRSRGKNIAILEGGFSQNMAVCGFGQLFRKNYKVQIPGKNHDRFPYTLAGPSCYSLDILATDLMLPELQEGDLVVFENCGSYGMSFSPGKFLGLEEALEFFLEDL